MGSDPLGKFAYLRKHSKTQKLLKQTDPKNWRYVSTTVPSILSKVFKNKLHFNTNFWQNNSRVLQGNWSPEIQNNNLLKF